MYLASTKRKAVMQDWLELESPSRFKGPDPTIGPRKRMLILLTVGSRRDVVADEPGPPLLRLEHVM